MKFSLFKYFGQISALKCRRKRVYTAVIACLIILSILKGCGWNNT
jgi:hypothetical protein